MRESRQPPFFNQRPWREISEVFFILSNLEYRRHQMHSMIQRFLNIILSHVHYYLLLPIYPIRCCKHSFYAVLNCSNFFRRHNNKVCYCSYLRQHTNCKVYQRKRHIWDILLLFVFDENIWEDLFIFRLYAMKILHTMELFPIKFTKKIIDEKAFLLHISIVYVNFVTK